jgi:hypothetical protein
VPDLTKLLSTMAEPPPAVVTEVHAEKLPLSKPSLKSVWLLGVELGVGVWVDVVAGVGVFVGVEIGVGVLVAVEIGVGVRVGVLVGVLVSVAVGVGVHAFWPLP